MRSWWLLLICFCWATVVSAQQPGATPDPFTTPPGEVDPAARAAAEILADLLVKPNGNDYKPPIDDGAEIKFVKLMAPYEYVGFATADAEQLERVAPLDLPFQRYVAVSDKSPGFYAAFTYGLNIAANRNPLLYRPVQLANGALIRIDLRALAAVESDFEEVFKTYEALDAVEKYYHAKAVAAVTPTVTKKTIEVAPYRAADGKTYTTKVVEVVENTPAVVLAPAQHANLPVLQRLHTLTKSNVPIMKAEQLMQIMLSTTGNGRYYQFRGLKKSDKNLTAEQRALAMVGADVNAVTNLRSDERAAMIRSRVTGKPRLIEFFYGSGTRPTIGPSLVVITRDYFEGTIDPLRHPFKNLLTTKFDGSEFIGILPNGMPLFAIFDGNRDLADSAPDKLVTDRMVPAPHSTILQGPISCIRCHGIDDGYKPAENHVKALLRNGLQITGDNTTIDSVTSIRQRTNGLFDGDLSEPLRIARTTQSRAIWALTGGLGIADVSAKLAGVYEDYVYSPVTPRQALRDLGYEVNDKDAVKLFNRVVPTLPRDQTGLSPDSVVTLMMRTWIPQPTKDDLHNRVSLFVNRDDWEQEFQDVMLRVVEEEVRTQKGHPAAGNIKVKAVDELPKAEANK